MIKRFTLILFLILPCLDHFGQENGYLIVDRITIEGNKVTKKDVILRELEFSVGDTVMKREIFDKLAASRNNLQNTLLFNFVHMDFMPEGIRINVRIRVVERWYIWPIPIFEHAERNFPAWLKDPDLEKLNYGLQLNWNNFRGRRETLQFKARLGYKQQFSLAYNKPNIGRQQKHGISFIINSFQQNEAIYRTVGNEPVFLRNGEGFLTTSLSPMMIYTYRPGLYLKHSFSAGYSSISFKVDSLREEYLGFGEDRGLNWFTATYSIEFDNRDYKIYPLSGYFFRFEVNRRGLGIVPGFNNGKTFFILAATQHQKLLQRLYLGNAAKVRLTSDDYQPYLFRQALGYNTYLRGFEYYLVDGNSYMVSLNDLKYTLVQSKSFNLRFIPWEQFSKIHFSLYSSLFFDFAWVDANQFSGSGNDLNNKLLWSTGIGLNLLSYYDQVYRLEFTLNSLRETGVYLHLEVPFSRW